MSLPRNERIRAFRQLKKEGIMKTNMQILRSRKEGSVKLLRERQPRKTETGKVKDKQRRGSAVVYCSECHGFVDSKYFSRHRKSCMSVDASTVPQSMPTSLMYDESDNGNYKRDILRSFHKDSIGKICVTDDLIVRFGYREFKTIRTQKDKQAERRATLKTKMRRLGTLFACFKRKCHAASVAVSSANDMFKRKNFTFLEDTIYTLTTENGDKVKNGLKIGFGYVLKSVCKYLHGEYLIQGKDAEATEMNRFLAVLNYHWASIFGDAEYANTIKRQEVLRKPQKLPKEQDIKTLRDYTLTKFQDLTNDTYLFVANTEYTLMRDLVVSRLTLFNARRGGEPSRLLLDEWNDALNDVWYNNTETVDDPLEKFLLGRYKLAYQSGKRVKLVPLLIVADCWKAMEILANPEVRKQANVFAYNRFVFPNTRLSPNHVSGWKAVEKCCQMAELDNSITATQMRHYVATVYAALEIPDEERKQFYEHMGHSEAVNKNVYQSPLALKEVVQVGGFLHRLDKGKTKK
ncbi:MAG: hypothetical protein N0C90_02355 [Candidatus Thiodiazotropha endolucinida]|nr:hypothetical protein [Candidatus Thiodiazotropha taylori]MCW4260191.1 hypothetical protein [Candidatus Thiodiazotropha endolucinida]